MELQTLVELSKGDAELLDTLLDEYNQLIEVYLASGGNLDHKDEMYIQAEKEGVLLGYKTLNGQPIIWNMVHPNAAFPPANREKAEIVIESDLVFLAPHLYTLVLWDKTVKRGQDTVKQEELITLIRRKYGEKQAQWVIDRTTELFSPKG